MRRLLLVVLTLTVLTTLALWRAGDAWASPPLGQQTGLACTACHDKPGSKLLTDKGKYFELLGSFEGFDQVIADFGACTSCHVRKPGSKKLTKEGRDFARIIRDMKDLQEWMRLRHPTKPPAPAATPPALMPAH